MSMARTQKYQRDVTPIPPAPLLYHSFKANPVHYDFTFFLSLSLPPSPSPLIYAALNAHPLTNI
jgi:hypothetical protein